jgi:ABC-type glycerol-3-phosphate transport system permease component
MFKSKGSIIITRLILVFVIISMLFPILWVLSLSVRLPDEVNESYFFLIPKHLSIANYIDAFEFSKKWIGLTFLEMFKNSIIVTLAALLISIIIASLAGFGYSNYKFKGKEISFTVLLMSFMLPVQVLLIPLFILLKKFGILNTYWAVIFPYVTFSIPIATLILRGFFEGIPKEIKESAKIDGATDFVMFLKIILPLSKPAIATCLIFLFLEIWNEFLYALIFLQKSNLQTIPIAIAKIGSGRFHIPLGTYAASIMITTIPVIIIFLVFQKWFIKGITQGAIKG